MLGAAGQDLQAGFTPVGSLVESVASRVQVVGQTAYVLNTGPQLQVLDVRDPATPALLGALSLSGEPRELQVVGTTVYIAEGFSGLRIVDVSNAASPTVLGSFNTSGQAEDVHVAGNVAYVADGESGVHALDVSNPAAIRRLGGFNSPGFANRLEMAGSTILLADGDRGLLVLDASDPASLRRLTNVVTSGYTTDISVVGNRACVVDSSTGLSLFDITAPSTPVWLGSSPVPQTPGSVTATGTLALVATLNRTWVFDISGGTVPVPAGSLEHRGTSLNSHLVGDLLYAAENSQGLQIYRVRLGIPQTFQWGGLPEALLLPGTTYPLTVTSSSGLPVGVGVISGPAVLDSAGLTVTNFGTVTLEARHPGNDTYLRAEEQRSFNRPTARFSRVGGLLTGHYANKVVVSGTVAYVADGFEGLKVLDVRNPATPLRRAHLPLLGDARDIQLRGDIAFLATTEEGLQLVDVSDPDLPRLVGEFPTEGRALAVEVADRVAYVAAGTGGLVIVNVSAPAAPLLLGQVAIPGEAAGVQVVGSLAYVAGGDAGLSVVDIADPKAPRVLGTVGLGGYAKAVDVVGSLAYVAAGSRGLQVVDVRQPGRPVLRGGEPGGFGAAFGVQVVGSIALVSDLIRGVRAVDVSTPDSLVVIGTSPKSAESYALQWVDGLAFVADGLAGIRILDVRIGLPQRLTWLAPAEGPVALGVPHPASVVADSGLPVEVVVESGPARLEQGLLTVTNLGTVVLRASTPGDAGRLPILEYRVYNRSEARLLELGSLAVGDSVLGLDLIGTTAYLAAGEAGLVIVDVANPSASRVLGRFNSPGLASDVRVVGSTAFVADGDSGLLVLDVADPSSIRRLSLANTPGSALALEVANSVVYLADKESGLQVIDVTDLTAPRRLSVVDTPDWAVGVALQGAVAYVADDTGGLVVVDIQNPASPVVLGGLNTSGLARDIAVRGDRVFLASGNAGLQVLDVSVPASPRLLGEIAIGGGATTVEVWENWVFVGTQGNGVQVVDVRNPANLSQVPSSGIAGFVSRLHAVGNRLYLAAGPSGFRIADFFLGQPQALEWRTPVSLSYSGSPLALDAITSSGLPIQYSVVSGPAAVEGAQLTLRGVGRVVLRAQQAGDGSYLPAAAEWVITVGPPRLGIRSVEGGAELHWVSGLEGLTLEGASNLPATGWEVVSLPRSEAQGEERVTVQDDRLRFFRLSGLGGLPEPIEINGWNRDVVLENQPGLRALAVDSFGGTWFESGLDGRAAGLPANRLVASLLDPQIEFALQPYNASNVLWLNNAGRPQSLTLQRPAAYATLYILAHSAGGGGTASVKIHYTDGSSSALLPVVAPDWWDGSPPTPLRRPAIRGLARSVSATRLDYDPVPPGFSLHQTDLDLSTGPDAGKRIERLEFVRASAAEVTCIFAVSGVEVVPVR
ncbi:MAG: hypothetical protein RIS76_2300 [Verrucomicrobiota bacterium]